MHTANDDFWSLRERIKMKSIFSMSLAKENSYSPEILLLALDTDNPALLKWLTKKTH